ncbi:MAG TPA: TAXI family TRAP transporter solute-binding subunit [Accumulibacter sp.]|uniref:TAXI family TRAP transporter solute-binding subunit n=1 Tax=Accumulibacter sp. TaxID=2053492 RepID=UPI002CAC45A9|nr:TAXI family TRAP transporter solute-binding subunit [Accumulibacter sp.]HNG17498.1 TAXI family TRAP transporter solute-binding subunit [Accumulibacter sp.]HNJ51885.1 TAXI family TRAP transporter solute-binding subunit [Accumulibacter sp.]HNL98778.1 TAXI family TRAP transporter solute-binding subunit [Accumulibacter sp.]
MRKWLIVGGLLFIVAGAFAAVWAWLPWMFSASYTIRVATGPVGSDGQKFMSAYKRVMAEEHPRVRLVLMESADLQGSADVLQAGKADIAVARSDHPGASSAGTLVILRRAALLVMVSAGSPVKSMKDLNGAKIAVLDEATASDPLFRTVMEFYRIRPHSIVQTRPADAGDVLQRREAAAVVALGLAGIEATADAARDILRASGKPPRFLNLKAKAIVAQHPVYEEIEIPAAAFVAAPAVPDDEVTTVALSVRLVARNSMLDDVAGELTRLLLATRAKLAVTWPHAGQVEPPDTDKKGFLPVHPGAAAYLDGNQVSAFERAMDMLFTLSILGGLLGSLALAVGGFWRRHRPDETRRNLAHLPAMLREVDSLSPANIEQMEQHLDGLVSQLLDQFVHQKIPPEQISAACAVIDQVRAHLARRRALSAAASDEPTAAKAVAGEARSG